jgi:SAM-dependent methyltransferase
MTWQQTWTDRFYRSRPGWQDGTSEFHELCREHAPPGARILEVGAGPSNPTSAFLATLGELHGIDVSDEVFGNTYLRKSDLIVGDRYPVPDETFDLVVSNYVVEHVANPREHLAEIRRVLKPGGRYVFRTPNLVHYVAIVSRFTPHRFHLFAANRLRALGPEEHDPWPTVYAMNTPVAVRRHARAAGMEVRRLDMVEKEPSYGMVAKPLFLAFMAYERLVNATDRLSGLRANMFAVLGKPPA